MSIQCFIQVLVVSSVELKNYQTQCRLRILTNIVYNQDQKKLGWPRDPRYVWSHILKDFLSWTKDGPLIFIVLSKAPPRCVLGAWTVWVHTRWGATMHVLVSPLLGPSRTIRNWHERWYFTSFSRGIGIQFSTSNNTTSRNGHWLVYRHCAKLIVKGQVDMFLLLPYFKASESS